MRAFSATTLESALFFLLLSTAWVFAAEMPPALREADRLYQSGRFAKASASARKFLKIVPANLEANLLIGMSEFKQNNYREAKNWFLRALKISSKNFIARKYLDLIQEIEHRHGPLAGELSAAQDSEDTYTSGKAFKKSWFGHGFPRESGPTREYFDPEKNMKAPIAIEVDAPIKKILVEKSVAKMAREAFAGKLYLKSFLFYSQLLSASPENRTFLLGKAESAFMLERYDEVVKLLGPVMLFKQQKSFSPEQLKLANDLLNKARKNLNQL